MTTQFHEKMAPLAEYLISIYNLFYQLNGYTDDNTPCISEKENSCCKYY